MMNDVLEKKIGALRLIYASLLPLSRCLYVNWDEC